MHAMHGASRFAPGHQKHRFGSVRGHPGASGSIRVSELIDKQSQDKAHRAHRAQLVRIENRAALGDLQHAAGPAQLVAILADELADRLATAITIHREIGGGTDSVAVNSDQSYIGDEAPRT